MICLKIREKEKLDISSAPFYINQDDFFLELHAKKKVHDGKICKLINNLCTHKDIIKWNFFAMLNDFLRFWFFLRCRDRGFLIIYCRNWVFIKNNLCFDFFILTISLFLKINYNRRCLLIWLYHILYTFSADTANIIITHKNTTLICLYKCIINILKQAVFKSKTYFNWFSTT